MKTTRLIGLLAGVSLAGWAAASGSKECAWLDRWLGLSGCLASFTLGSLTDLGSTMEFDKDGHLVILSVDYRKYGSEQRSYPQLVTADLENGREIDRAELDFKGRPDQLRLSPRDESIAVICSDIYVCDLVNVRGKERNNVCAMIAVFERGGKKIWDGSVSRDVISGNAEGRAGDLAFSADGVLVAAGPTSFAPENGSLSGRVSRELAPDGFAIYGVDHVKIAGEERSFVSPEGYVSFARMRAMPSPDGRLLAVLSRHFSGEGEIRAILLVFDRETGAMLDRHDIGTDLCPALAWGPEGETLIVAAVDARGLGATTEIRLYPAGVRE